MSVYPKLIGRLGNQMFQISAAIGYSKKHNIPYWVPKQSIAEHIWPAMFKHFPSEPMPGVSYVHYKEPEHSYNEIPFRQNICIEGFFQSQKYFDHCRQDIIDAFQIPYKKLDGFVMIHVRRSDYLEMQDKHPVITYDYISEAVKHFISFGYKSFVVCSDDIKWCRIQFKPLELYGAVFSYSSGNGPIEDLALLSCGEHFIGSNSSFSWWAYYLNQNPDKIGIFPETWFGPGNSHLSTKDIYPEGVIKM